MTNAPKPGDFSHIQNWVRENVPEPTRKSVGFYLGSLVSVEGLRGKEITDRILLAADFAIYGMKDHLRKDERTTFSVSREDIAPPRPDPAQEIQRRRMDAFNEEESRKFSAAMTTADRVTHLESEVQALCDSQQKLLDTLEVQLRTIQNLHDTINTHTGMIARLQGGDDE